MTATIVDLAARRAERDAASQADNEVESYGVAQWPGAEGFEFYAEMRSGRRVTLADGLAWDDAYRRLRKAIGAQRSQSNSTIGCRRAN